METCTGRYWNRVVSPGEYGDEILTAIFNHEYLTLKRILRRYRDLHPEKTEHFARVFGPLMLDSALKVEALTKSFFGEKSEKHWRAVKITKSIQIYIRSRVSNKDKDRELWDRPTNPITHAIIPYFPEHMLKPSQKELTRALVPCHNSSLEDATYILDNFFNDIFTGGDRVKWIWNLAQRSDREARAGLWLQEIHPRSL